MNTNNQLMSPPCGWLGRWRHQSPIALAFTLPYISPFTVIGEKGDFLRRFFLLYRIEITVLAGESRLMKRESGENPEQCPLL